MKILIVCNNSAGLERFRGKLLQSLIEKEHDIVLAVPKSEKDTEIQAQRRIKTLGCKLIQVPMERRGMNPVKDISLFLAYRKHIEEQRPDYVITYTIKPNIYAGLECRLKKVPYAANITGLGTAFQKSGVLKKIVTVMYKFSLGRAKVIFFENSENRNSMVDMGIVDVKQTHVLHGAGVDLCHFKYENYPQNDSEIRFLFIGRVMEEKGIHELFTAMQMLRNDKEKCCLHIVGSFEEDYSKEIEQYQKEGWLNYHGVQNDVRSFIANSHCVVLPSWHEGMANTNLEGASMGRPLITSDIAGCKEAVIKNVSGFLCESQNAESLYEKMKQFIGLPYEQKVSMGRKGREWMEEVFDKEKVVEETIKIMGV